MITIQELKKSFGKTEVLTGLNLRFGRGGVAAVLGPNGSGKTTLMKCILGMVLPDQGRIEVDGRDIRGRWAYRNMIGYLPQIARFPENLRVRELLRMIKDIRGATTDDRPLIEQFELQDHLHKKLGHLSGGTRQKVNIVQALMYDHPILILDEPTAGLDPVALTRLKALIRREQERGKLVLVTTHIMSFVEEMAEEVVFLLEGKVHYRGAVEQLITEYPGNNLEEAVASLLKKQDVNGPGPRSGASLDSAAHFPSIH